MRNILIIGGNRFFGRHLVSSLIENGEKPVLLNRQKLDDGFGSKVERIKGDRDNYDDLHHAAQSRKWDLVYDQVCFTATQARAALSHFKGQVGRYIVTSSQSVYDYGVNLSETVFEPLRHQFTREADRLQDYGEAKRQMEAVFYQKAEFPVIAVRMPLVLGKDDYTKRLHWHFDRLKKGQGVYFPNLKAKIAFVDSKEAGQVLMKLGSVDWKRPVNVASQGQMSLQNLLQEIEKRVGLNFHFDKVAGNDNVSPYGISNDWFMNTQQLEKLGIQTSNLQSWLPDLLDYEASLVR